MQSFAGAGRQEHAVEINLFLPIKATSPRDRQERLVTLRTAANSHPALFRGGRSQCKIKETWCS